MIIYSLLNLLPYFFKKILTILMGVFIQVLLSLEYCIITIIFYGDSLNSINQIFGDAQLI